MKIRILLITLLGMVFTESVMAAPQTVDFESMQTLLSDARVGDVSTRTPVRVPMITWGGDIATILANGNAAKTRSGSLFASQGLNLDEIENGTFARLSCRASASDFVRPSTTISSG